MTIPLLLSLLPLLGAVNADAPPTTAAAVLDLFPDELGPKPVVKVVGVVTFVTPDGKVLYLQDDTAGVCVPVDAGTVVKPGTKVEVTGRACSGYWCPVVAATAVRDLGPAPLPDPVPFDLNPERVRWVYGQYIDCRGLAVAADRWEGYARLTVRGAGGEAHLLVPGPESVVALRRLVGAVVRARGVAGFPVVDDGQPQGLPRVFVTSADAIRVLRTAEQVKGRRPRSLADLKRVTPGPDVGGALVRVTGTVTACLEGGRRVYLADGPNAVLVIPQLPTEVAVGDRVEAAGQVVALGQYVRLSHATLSRLGPGTPPDPVSLTPTDVATDAHPYALVRTELVVENDDSWEGGRRVTGWAGANRVLLLFGQPPDGFGLAAGTRISAVGLHGPVSAALGLNAQAYVIGVRDSADLTVLELPPPPTWWTPRRVAAVVGGLGGAVVLAVAWARLLRREVRRRTAALQESEQKFATAFRSSPDAIMITRTADGLLLDVNERYTSLSGRSREESIGRTSTEVGWADPADRERMMGELRATGRVQDFTTRMRSAGGVRDVVLSSEPITLGGVPCLLGRSGT